MLHSLIKGWYLCCHKYGIELVIHRQVFIPLKACHSLKEIQLLTIRCSYKPNEQMKQFLSLHVF